MGRRSLATITILDAVNCEANKEAKKYFLEALRYKAEQYQRSKWARAPNGKAVMVPGYNKEIEKYLISGGRSQKGIFLTGLLPRIRKYLRTNKSLDKITFQGKQEKLTPSNRIPKLPGITFREDQLKALRIVARKQRGLIVFPTGSGKTIIACGIINMFAEYRILFLCHTLDLVNQASASFAEFNIDHDILSGENKVNWKTLKAKNKCLLVSTIQSFSKLSSKVYMDFFDVMIVDEVHHAAEEKTQYGKVLSRSLSPIRIGLTATLPTNGYQRLVVEGFFGQVLSELTNAEGVKIGILARPRVKLIPVPKEINLVAKIKRKSFNAFYDACIVNNLTRNKLIVDLVRRRTNHNRSVLIMVDKIEHGKKLFAMFYELGIECPFIEGNRNSEYRAKVKNDLIKKKILATICTKAWREGINIPTLNTVIRAEGLKDEKVVKQAMGRGLRIAEGKKRIELIDFLDPYPYLAEHSVERYKIYYELKWL